jgi:pimeloyl-ACP methyl ester carboxylesterase
MSAANDLDLAFEAVGEGPPLLILHGLFGSSTNWRSIARRLSTSHRVFSVDLRNHGASPWAESMDYVVMAGDVARLIERQGLERPSLIGHSMGGKVAMALALLQPQRVGRLIVVDIAPVQYADRLSAFAEAMRTVDATQAASREEVRQRLAGKLPDAAGVVPFLMQNLVVRNAHFDWRINLPVISASMPALSGFPPALQELRFERRLQVIAGGRSDYVQRREGAEFAPMFPHTQVEFIESAGHWVHADQPEAFLAAAQRALHDATP